MRRLFFLELWNGLKLVWPILSGLLGTRARDPAIRLDGLKRMRLLFACGVTT
ncbi:MAG TPA: hypothetical protein VLF42_06785 [Burkholderiales bacterium]|nr:hypothetical protein [Burkholderiales bacterium]